MKCPINHCVFDVPGPLRICPAHFKLVPRPQQDALNHYARTRKGGPSHVGAFERAVESVIKTIEARTPKPVPVPERVVSTPYRDD